MNNLVFAILPAVGPLCPSGSCSITMESEKTSDFSPKIKWRAGLMILINPEVKKTNIFFRLVAAVFRVFSSEVLGYDINVKNQSSNSVSRPLSVQSQTLYSSSTPLQDSDLTFRQLSSCTNPLWVLDKLDPLVLLAWPSLSVLLWLQLGDI